MKKIILVLLIVLISSINSFSQQEEIQSDFEDYLELIQSQQFEKAMDYMYPEFFELMSKEMMVSLMEQTFNTPELTISLSDPTIDSVGVVEYLDSMYFAPVNYTHIMTMKFNQGEGDTDEDIKFRDEMAVASLKIKFGEYKVTYDSVSKEMLITSSKLVYARSKNGKTNWKFIELDPENMFMIKSMLPEEIYNRVSQ
jgi:hypothetical protein